MRVSTTLTKSFGITTLTALLVADTTGCRERQREIGQDATRVSLPALATHAYVWGGRDVEISLAHLQITKVVSKGRFGIPQERRILPSPVSGWDTGVHTYTATDTTGTNTIRIISPGKLEGISQIVGRVEYNKNADYPVQIVISPPEWKKANRMSLDLVSR